MKLERKCKFANLFNFYKPVLTQKKQEICEKYYNRDITIVEIAAQENVSRQAIKDLLYKSEAAMEKYDQKLKLPDIYFKQQKIITRLIKKNPDLADDLNKILKAWENK